MLMRYKESPEPPMVPPGSENKVLHANLRMGDNVLMVSDGRCTGQPSFQGFGLTITVKTAAEAEQVFGALSEGGKVQAPLDRFGVLWMVIVAH